MVFQWLESRSGLMTDSKTTVVVVAGKSIGAFAERMAALFREVRFELRDTVPSEVNVREDHFRRLFLLYGVLWILDDQTCLALLRKFVPLLLHPSRPILLVCDLVSPEKGQFETHVELAFRRRDVTLMTSEQLLHTIFTPLRTRHAPFPTYITKKPQAAGIEKGCALPRAVFT